MLRRLFQWLKKFFKRPFGSQQTHSQNATRGRRVVESPPELTNADLELLFTQMLEGVHQARGKQWVVKYLQRMENRIGDDRWLSWLLVFGERLLISPAPNLQLATRMVQLGELGIGQIGELAYEIGIRLLTRNMATEYGENEEPEEVETTTPEETLLISPGEELIRNLGERLWDYEEEEGESTIPAPEFISVQETWTGNLGELIWEYDQQIDSETTKRATLLIPSEEDAIAHLGELFWDYHEPEQVETITPEPLLTPHPEAREIPPLIEEKQEQSLARSEPDVAEVLDVLLGRLDENTNLVQQLVSDLAIQKSNPQVIVESKSEQAQAFFYQALQQAKTGNLLGAIAFYNQAIELKPEYYEYWFNLALTLFHLERFAEAIASYEQVIRLKPDHYKAWYNRGGILGELGQFDEAIACFEQVIKIQPEYQQAWSSRGLALLKLGQLWEAISSYDQALVLQPEDQDNWYYRGIALALGEQYEEAIASYDKALEIQPDYQEVWIDRGVVLFNLGRWSEAIASYDQALEIQPDFYLAWYNRGIALDNLFHREEAIASYRKAITIKPDFHVAWYNQAVAMFYLGRFAEAIASYDSALQINLDYWEAWIGRGTAAGNLVNPDALLNLFTSITATNPALKESGYQGKLASYQEGLKYVRPDTYPEGWGRLHLAIANTHYERGKKHSTPRYYWQQAVAEYNQALSTLTIEDFPKLHLEVLQSLIKTHLGLGETEPAQEFLRQATDLFHQLIFEPTRSDDSKKQLSLKFAGLGQLAVDLAVEYGDLVEAWEIAEDGKNTCFNSLLFGLREEIYSPRYDSIQELLNPTTAIIYWHVSPTCLHTFILKDEAPSPILIFTPMQNFGVIPSTVATIYGDEFPLPEAVERLREFETWLEDWHQQYQEYRQIQDQQSKRNHSWHLDMEQRLLELRNLLNISTIEQELEGITQLILIPHRELHRLPIHALFGHYSLFEEDISSVAANYTISYLPSVQIGLTLKAEPIWHKDNQLFLSVEYPNSTGYSPLKFAKMQSELVSEMFVHCQRIQGGQATKNIVENALFDDHHIFHFTGHSTNNLTEPRKSELALAYEDKLTLEEIIQQTLVSYNLVTLSGCETISNHNHNITSEYVDLVSGFLSAGVSLVVSTLWTVESFANALVMIEFYRRLQPDKSAATALTEATAWLKELTARELTQWYEDLLLNLRPDELRIRAYVATQMYRTSKLAPEQKLYTHPYFWAAFTIAGKLQ
ncbi:MAG: tetratricopeptide repeat protein [Gloeotrichia echinulata HAB0833]